MKTAIKTLLLCVLAVLVLPGCEKYLDDVTENPNNPTIATPASLLSSIEVATFSNYTGNSARRAAILTQQMAGTDGQMIALANYQILEGDVTNEWSSIYTNAVVNCNLLIDTYGEKSPYYSGIAKIFKAINIGLATDMWGDVPYKEAGLGLSGTTSPAYDTQESILNGIQDLLSEAIADLAKAPEANSYFPDADFVFGGNPASWTTTAWMLKARYANRLSKRDPGGSAAKVLEYLSNAGMTGPENDANAIFGEGGNELNQWFAFESSRSGYIRLGENFVNTMTTNADPRLPFFAGADEAGGYSGSPEDPGSANIGASPVGPYYGSPSSVSPLMSYVEAKFIEAEAQLRAGNADGAATAMNDAVKSSVLQITGSSDEAYETTFASETGASISLEKIMTQKYFALFTQIEVWNDWRRTDLPALTPNPSGQVSGIPTILPTSQDERLYNSNAVVVTNILSKVWWDVD